MVSYLLVQREECEVQVAEGIFQVQLPLPFPLRIVNCYLLRDDNGWTIIDTGINYPAGRAAWQAALAELEIAPKTIQRIILTHAHPDHFGMAGWLAQQSGASVQLAPLEQEFVRTAWHAGAANEQAVVDFFQTHGMPVELAEQVRHGMAATRAMTLPWPATRAIEPGGSLQIGARRFQVIATPGHSDQHLVFYCAEERLLLCGDAVLIKITPNISRWPHGRPNPLADFLQSLDRLATLYVDLALPGHGPLIRAFGERLAELRAHHYERLELMEQATGNGATAFSICAEVFPTTALSPHQLRFAMAETLAHLDYLVGVGRLESAGTMYRRLSHDKQTTLTLSEVEGDNVTDGMHNTRRKTL
jgi:glyoxylase-like metal-dependent hydrolase (beta-lactamase superfamily II)